MSEAHPDSDFSDEELTPLDTSFNKASEHVRKITSNLNNNQLLELYGLFKQGTEGECNIQKPGWLDSRGRRKWDAWNSLAGMDSDEAKQKYIILVQKCDPSWTDLSDNNVPGSKEAWVAVSSMRYSPEPELIHNEMSILDAARENCHERVAELLAKHPSLREERDENNLTALHWAADRDSTRSLLAAIAGGCDINAIDDCGQTPLHYAASCGHIESTKILVESGASLLPDDEDCTPLELATDNDIKQILEGAIR